VIRFGSSMRISTESSKPAQISRFVLVAVSRAPAPRASGARFRATRGVAQEGDEDGRAEGLRDRAMRHEAEKARRRKCVRAVDKRKAAVGRWSARERGGLGAGVRTLGRGGPDAGAGGNSGTDARGLRRRFATALDRGALAAPCRRSARIRKRFVRGRQFEQYVGVPTRGRREGRRASRGRGGLGVESAARRRCSSTVMGRAQRSAASERVHSNPSKIQSRGSTELGAAGPSGVGKCESAVENGFFFC